MIILNTVHFENEFRTHVITCWPKEHAPKFLATDHGNANMWLRKVHVGITFFFIRPLPIYVYLLSQVLGQLGRNFFGHLYGIGSKFHHLPSKVEKYCPHFSDHFIQNVNINTVKRKVWELVTSNFSHSYLCVKNSCFKCVLELSERYTTKVICSY